MIGRSVDQMINDHGYLRAQRNGRKAWARLGLDPPHRPVLRNWCRPRRASQHVSRKS